MWIKEIMYGICRNAKAILNQKKRSKENWIHRKELTAVNGNKITGKAVVKTLGMIQTRTSIKSIILIKFTRKKKFKFKEFIKKDMDQLFKVK
jgi:hypothetical protein